MNSLKFKNLFEKQKNMPEANKIIITIQNIKFISSFSAATIDIGKNSNILNSFYGCLIYYRIPITYIFNA